nr:unnamed protein product [Callosobruchus chinensis]
MSPPRSRNGKMSAGSHRNRSTVRPNRSSRLHPGHSKLQHPQDIGEGRKRSAKLQSGVAQSHHVRLGGVQVQQILVSIGLYC